MLVFSREVGTSIIVRSPDATCVVTVLKLYADQRAISMLVNRTTAAEPAQLDSRTADLQLNGTFKISDTVELILIDAHPDKVRLGINAPRKCSVDRLEVYEAIRRQGDEGDHDGEMGGSPVPRPSSPTPPGLDVHLAEPRSDDEGDE